MTDAAADVKRRANLKFLPKSTEDGGNFMVKMPDNKGVLCIRGHLLFRLPLIWIDAGWYKRDMHLGDDMKALLKKLQNIADSSKGKL